MKITKAFFNGLWNENPTFRLVLGMCPTIAISKTAMSGLGMGAAATFVLVGSNLVISLLRNFIPDKVRIPAFVVVIATFVGMVEMIVKAYLPALNDSLGIFIPLIVVNCIILARAEAFASQNGPIASIADGLGMGIGFTMSITTVSIVREVLGAGQVFGISLFGEGFMPAQMFAQAPGGFLILGMLMGLFGIVSNKMKKKQGVEN